MTDNACDATDAEFLPDSDLNFHHPVDEVVEDLVEGRLVTVSGLQGSFAAAVVAELGERHPKPLVLVVGDRKTAQSLTNSLEALGVGTPGHEILCFPPEDVSPYGNISPDRTGVMERLNGQFRLAMGDEVRVVIIPVQAAMRKTAPWTAIEAASTMVAVGDNVDLEELRRTLMLGGYTAVRLVEDVGTFAIRGGIIDVFSPYQEQPVRIDLFSDEVETIRVYDPKTQRTFADLDDIFIFPVREEILNEGTLANAQIELRDVAETLRLASSHVNQIIADLKSNYRFLGIESLLPAFYELQPPVDLFPSDATWVIFEPATLVEVAQNLWDQRIGEYERLISDGELAFPPNRFYIEPTHLFEELREKRPLVEVATVGEEAGAAHTFRCHLNDDVVRLRKQHDNSEATVRALLSRIKHWRDVYQRVVFSCQTQGTSQRLATLLRSCGLRTSVADGHIPLAEATPSEIDDLRIYTTNLSAGFRSPSLGLAIVTGEEVFGRKRRKRRARRVLEEAIAIGHFRELSRGDLVVHVEFGVARYLGMETLALDGIASDYFKLEFAGEDKLYLPIYRLGRIQKYVSDSRAKMALDRLGTGRWEKAKAKVRKELLEIADELLRIHAARAARSGESYPSPGEYLRDFETAFPYEETPHQETAISEILADLAAPKPMDRLLCGDVGFGKTEVAMRAAFTVVFSGRQVAILVPTTILAEQHLRSFSERFRSFPIRVEALSRFRTGKQQKELIQDTKDGKVDILIGTHRLLSKDVEFLRLGLIVIDEEQRFGVRHKERLKQLKTNIDVLTMTATPIPRTLEMSLLGIRDLSIILTPPTDRLAVRTYVAQFKDSVVREGIERELRRGGQVFFVHNRVQGIEALAQKIRSIVPAARVAVGHAQLSNAALERIMFDFVERKTDVLVCTTIVESGLDIVGANTMFINRADMFGLAQLYQLRGRVGRGRERGYCFLLVRARKKLPKDAAQRLEVIRTHSELGSGIVVAQHDLDIRGAGNLLGQDQSGHIKNIGYDLYCELLDEAVRQLKGEDLQETIEPEVKVPVEAFLPRSYMPDEGLRLLFYKRLSMADNGEELDALFEEILDRFGRPPVEALNLRQVVLTKIALKDLRIALVETGPKAVVLTLDEKCLLSPDKVVDLVQRCQGRYELRHDLRLIRHLHGKETDDLLATTRETISQISKCVA